VRARFSAPIQTGPGVHSASCTMVTGSFPGGKERPGRDADPSPPFSAVGHERVELYLYSPLWAVRPVQSLSACTRVTFTFTFTYIRTCKSYSTWGCSMTYMYNKFISAQHDVQLCDKFLEQQMLHETYKQTWHVKWPVTSTWSTRRHCRRPR